MKGVEMVDAGTSYGMIYDGPISGDGLRHLREAAREARAQADALGWHREAMASAGDDAWAHMVTQVWSYAEAVAGKLEEAVSYHESRKKEEGDE